VCDSTADIKCPGHMTASASPIYASDMSDVAYQAVALLTPTHVLSSVLLTAHVPCAVMSSDSSAPELATFGSGRLHMHMVHDATVDTYSAAPIPSSSGGGRLAVSIHLDTMATLIRRGCAIHIVSVPNSRVRFERSDTCVGSDVCYCTSPIRRWTPLITSDPPSSFLPLDDMQQRTYACNIPLRSSFFNETYTRRLIYRNLYPQS
jgi:hypothetical protein